MPGTREGAAKARATRISKAKEVRPVTHQPLRDPVVQSEQEEAIMEQVGAIVVKDAEAAARADARVRAQFGVGRLKDSRPITGYVVVRRPLAWEGLELQVGEEVPGAETWPRVDAWVRAGRIAPAYGERMTSIEEPVEAGEPEELDENLTSAPEDDDPLSHTGAPVEEETA